MTEFPIHHECEACDLCEQCDSVGLPTRPLDERDAKPHGEFLVPRKRAVLFIGEAPGSNEDHEARSWCGWTGKLLTRLLLTTYKLHDHADIYLSNAVRCRPPANEAPAKRQLTACRPHLLQDISTLLDMYGQDNLFLCCLGAKATDQLAGTTITKALLSQGLPAIPKKSELPPVRMFYSYHPAAMAPGRQPELIHPFDAHLNQLSRAVQDTEQSIKDLPVIQQAPVDLGPVARAYTAGLPTLSLDIETYGVLRAHEQTCFHPHKSYCVDGIPYKAQVISCSLAWFDRHGDKHTAFYNLQRHAGRHALYAALSRTNARLLVGLNIPFDIMYLRAFSPLFQHILRPDRWLLEDLAIVNHLHADTRPEKSLKTLSHLFATANYHALPVSLLKGATKAKSADDPNLAFYNCTDTVSGLDLYNILMTGLHTRWASEAHTEFDRLQFRSDLCWTTIHMDESGLAFDRQALQYLHNNLEIEDMRAIRDANHLGYTLAGKGSVTSIRQMIQEACKDANLLSDHRLALTDKKKEISTGKDNVHLLLGNLPMDSPRRRPIELLEKHRTTSKVTSSYTGPLLHEPRRGLLTGGIAYPNWFPVRTFVKDQAGKEGGTRQGRFAAQHPAAQTMPPSIKDTLTSRYPGGYLFRYDFSQIELRIAAVLSHDEAMCLAYRSSNPDYHHDSAAVIWPGLIRNDPNPQPDGIAYALKRHLGKRWNFRFLYRGGAGVQVEVARKDVGIELSIGFVEEADRRLWAKRQGLFAWQEKLIHLATTQGYLVLPTGWRRTFIRSAHLVETSYINEICNFPVQTWAAQVTQSAQAAILQMRRETRLPFLMPAQIHDDIVIDCPPECAHETDQRIRKILANPPLWRYLLEYANNDIPMQFEAKTKRNVA